MKMNRKGFTLVELLAVILVIALIATFALPQILTQFSNNSDKLSKQQIEMIEEAGLTYVELNKKIYSGEECIKLDELVEADLLNEGFVKDAIGNDYNEKKRLKVTYKNNQYTVKLVNRDKCNP